MKLACKDLNPSSSCDFVATGNTNEEVAQYMMSHAKANHTDDLAKMNMSDADIMSMMVSKTHA